MIGYKKVEKPKIRGKWRKYFGKRYFIVRRYLRWIFKFSSFAKNIGDKKLSHVVKEHSTILLRPLKDVDMQYQHNKIRNLELAIKNINGILIQPGETFSLWYLVGRPSKSKGYLKGLVLNNGKIGYDYGGGLCQLGNLLFWMFLHSPLKVTERWRHSFDVFPDVNRKLPFGSGATLSYNYIDLQVFNPTKTTFQLNLWLTKDRLHGQLCANENIGFEYEIYEDQHMFRQEMWGGYTRHNVLRRKVYEKGSSKLISDELVTENHAIMMYNPLLE